MFWYNTIDLTEYQNILFEKYWSETKHSIQLNNIWINPKYPIKIQRNPNDLIQPSKTIFYIWLV